MLMPRPHFSPIIQDLERWRLGSEFSSIPGDSSVQPGYDSVTHKMKFQILDENH